MTTATPDAGADRPRDPARRSRSPTRSGTTSSSRAPSCERRRGRPRDGAAGSSSGDEDADDILRARRRRARRLGRGGLGRHLLRRGRRARARPAGGNGRPRGRAPRCRSSTTATRVAELAADRCRRPALLGGSPTWSPCSASSAGTPAAFPGTTTARDRRRRPGPRGRAAPRCVALDADVRRRRRGRARPPRLDLPQRRRRPGLRRGGRRADGAAHPPRRAHDVLLGPGLRRLAGGAADRAGLRGLRLELARAPARPAPPLGRRRARRLARRPPADERAGRRRPPRRCSGSGRRS